MAQAERRARRLRGLAAGALNVAPDVLARLKRSWDARVLVKLEQGGGREIKLGKSLSVSL
jgi:hypothetical protein